MGRQGGLLLACLATGCALALGVATASAGRLSITSQSISITWSAVRFNEGAAVCPVTMEGSLHGRTMAKSAGTLVGFVMRARTSRCSVGTAVLLTVEDGQTSTVPWHIRYDSFSGALPDITRVRWHIVGLSYRVLEELEFCLYTSTTTRPALLDLTREAGGAVTTAAFFGTEAIPLVAGNSVLCDQSGLLGGSGSVTLQGSATRVTLSLI
ncbi:MAG TPA: hypothetical protein VF250_05380 [Conexibacter sp.]